MNFDLIFFDLDGTLADTAEDICYSVNLAFKELGLKSRPLPEVKAAIGGGAKILMERLLADKDLDIDLAVKTFINFYHKHPVMTTTVYPEVIDTLKKLKQTKIMLTNKPEIITQAILERLGITELFHTVIGGDTFPTKKPDPYAINSMLERFNTRPDQAVMVGDTSTDIETAHKAGIKCIAVSYGYALPGELETADWQINSFNEILSLIKI